MIRARALVLAIAVATGTLALAAPVPPVAAEPADARARQLLAAGERLFGEQEYAQAIKVLVPVTRDAAAARADRVRAWELIALARFITGDQPGARDAFERVLEVDPGFQLRDRSGSPRIRTFFDDVRRAVGGAAGEIDLEHAAPRAGTAGTRLELEVRARRGGAAVVEVAILHRLVGALGFQTTPMRAAGDSQWRGAIPLASARRALTIEYYLEARGPGGSVLARIAGPDGPLVIPVAPGGSDPTGWYRHWYTLAGAAAFAAGATGVIIWATRGPDDGSLPPGRVVVSP